MIESNSLRKRFCSDFKLPISIFSEPYFSYYVDLYNKEYEIDKKIVLLNKVYEGVNNNVEDFLSYSFKLSEKIKTEVINSKAYDKLNNVDFNKEFPLIADIPNRNIYISENEGKRLISIDLKQANYNCLDFFDIKKELNAENYAQLIKKYTEYDYYVESKKIRQVIFGELNPKRQQRLQKHVIHKYCEELQKHGYKLSSASSDEIIIESESANIKDIKNILLKFPEKYQFYRIEEFTINKILEDKDFYIKEIKDEFNNTKHEFKNIPTYFFAQVYKHYKELEINEYDLMFYHDGLLSVFKESIFDKNQNKNRNNFKIG